MSNIEPLGLDLRLEKISIKSTASKNETLPEKGTLKALNWADKKEKIAKKAYLINQLRNTLKQ